MYRGEVIERNELKFMKEKVVDGRRATAQVIAELFEETDEEVFVVYIDGLPGGGKTGLEEHIAHETEKRGHCTRANICTIPLDLCMGTERNSPERGALTQRGARYFHDHHIRYALARHITEEAIDTALAGTGKSIHIDKAYTGNATGTFEPYEITVPHDTRIVLVEGVGSLGHVEQRIMKRSGVREESIWLHTTNLQSLFRATLRDVLKGKRGVTFEGRYAERVAENDFLIPMLRPTAPLATVICNRYPRKDTFGEKLVEKEEQIIDGEQPAATTISAVLQSLDPDFLEKIFPGQVPKQLLRGSDRVSLI